MKSLFESIASGIPSRSGLASFERALRLVAGFALLGLGWFSIRSPFLLAAGALVLFSAFYDRCPLWQALSLRLVRLFRRVTGSS